MDRTGFWFDNREWHWGCFQPVLGMLYSLTGWRLQVWLGQSIRYHKQPGESGIVLFDSAQPNQMEPSLFSFCTFACIAASGGLNGGHSGEKGFMYIKFNVHGLDFGSG